MVNLGCCGNWFSSFWHVLSIHLFSPDGARWQSKRARARRSQDNWITWTTKGYSNADKKQRCNPELWLCHMEWRPQFSTWPESRGRGPMGLQWSSIPCRCTSYFKWWSVETSYGRRYMLLQESFILTYFLNVFPFLQLTCIRCQLSTFKIKTPTHTQNCFRICIQWFSRRAHHISPDVQIRSGDRQFWLF